MFFEKTQNSYKKYFKMRIKAWGIFKIFDPGINPLALDRLLTVRIGPFNKTGFQTDTLNSLCGWLAL